MIGNPWRHRSSAHDQPNSRITADFFMTPQTTFAGPSPFGTYISSVKHPHIYQKRRISLGSLGVKKVFDAIINHPGVTAGKLIELTKNSSASEYAELLRRAGEVDIIYKRTHKSQHISGIRHYYPKGVTE
jgi:hypothetical protein